METFKAAFTGRFFLGLFHFSFSHQFLCVHIKKKLPIINHRIRNFSYYSATKPLDCLQISMPYINLVSLWFIKTTINILRKNMRHSLQSMNFPNKSKNLSFESKNQSIKRIRNRKCSYPMRYC